MRSAVGAAIVAAMPQLPPLSSDALIELSPDTAEAVATAHAWERAFNERDLDRMLALSTEDCDLPTRHADRGHDAVRRLLHLQSYGVAHHVRACRYLARGATVVVDAVIELRWVETGELAETTQGAAVIDVHDGRVRRFRPQPDVPSALQAAGWTGRETLGRGRSH